MDIYTYIYIYICIHIYIYICKSLDTLYFWCTDLTSHYGHWGCRHMVTKFFLHLHDDISLVIFVTPEPWLLGSYQSEMKCISKQNFQRRVPDVGLHTHTHTIISSKIKIHIHLFFSFFQSSQQLCPHDLHHENGRTESAKGRVRDFLQ